MIEDEIIREEMYWQLDEHYESFDPETMFGEIEIELTELVMNTLVMDQKDAAKFVQHWFECRH